MALVFVLMVFQKGSDRLEREVPLVGLSLQEAQEVLGMDAADQMYECVLLPESVARRLQAATPIPLDTSMHDYYLERSDVPPEKWTKPDFRTSLG